MTKQNQQLEEVKMKTPSNMTNREIEAAIKNELINWIEPFCSAHGVKPCKTCGNLKESFERVAKIASEKEVKLTRVQGINQVKELFDMVYQWGRVGAVVDYKAPAFQRDIKELKKSEYFCPCDLLECPDSGEKCQICGEIID